MSKTLETALFEKIRQDEVAPERFRSNIASQLHVRLVAAMQSDSTPTSYSRNLERGVFNASLAKCERFGTPKLWKNERFVEVYLRTLHHVFYALGHTNVREGLCAKKIRPHELPFMTHQEVSPEKWASLLDKKTKREQNMFKSNVQASTDSYTCRRCKSKECTFYQMQTRSADEPMTIFISCITCGNQWKQ